MYEKESSPSNQPEHITSEQIPHSGIHHDEYPVNEFDNTPLPEAVERGLVKPMPDTLAGLEQIESTEKKSHKKLIIGGAAFLAGAAVIAGSVIGIKAAGDAPNNTPPAPDPKATSQTPEATPTPSSTPEQQLTVQSLEIPAGETPEQLGVAFVQDRFSKWEMAGATPEVEKLWGTASGSTGDFVTAQAANSAPIFGDALFVPGYQSDPRLSGFVADQAKSNAHSLESWLLTYQSGDPADLQPYNRGLTVESTKVVSQDANGLTIAVAATEHDNAAKNRMGTTYASSFTSQVNGNKILITLTLTQVNGTEKISAMTIGGR